MKSVSFTETEWHRMAYHKYYTISEEDVEGHFDTIERFFEVLTHQEPEMFGPFDPQGELPTDEENDAFFEVIMSVGHMDSEDDIFTMRKGGFDITYKDAKWDEE